MGLKIDLIIGIDPGANGALAIWKKDNPIETKKMPEELIDLSGYFQHVKNIAENPVIFLEKIQLRPEDLQGGKAFRVQKLLGAFEQLKAIIAISGIPYILVAPMKWQSGLKLRQKEENTELVTATIDRITQKRKNEGKEITEQGEYELSDRAKKQIRKNRYKEVAQSYYPEIKVTLENCDALLICHFGRYMNFTNPEWILENLPKPLHKKLL